MKMVALSSDTFSFPFAVAAFSFVEMTKDLSFSGSREDYPVSNFIVSVVT